MPPLLPKPFKAVARTLLCGAALLLSVPATSFADAKMDQVFNEEAIQRYLAEVSPKVSYLIRLKMMKAHLAASVLNLNAGRNDDASKHLSHPINEIWAEMEAAMTEVEAKELQAALHAAMHSVGKTDNAEIIARIEKASVILSRLDAETTKQLEDPNMLADVAGVLLRTAVIEYHEAFDGKTIKNLVEYHDGAMFVREVQAIMETIGPALEAKDAAKFAKIKASLEKLYAAWPVSGVPDKVVSVTKLQSLVTVTELRLAELR
jgi:hypothetical protein